MFYRLFSKIYANGVVLLTILQSTSFTNILFLVLLALCKVNCPAAVLLLRYSSDFVPELVTLKVVFWRFFGNLVNFTY